MNAAAKNKTVYILLTRTDTLFSRLIAVVTGTEYTHAALSLDYGLTRLYSFGRLYAYIPWIGCFKHEDTATGVYGRFRRSPCALFKLEVSETSFDAICLRIREMARNSSRYRYNVIGLFGNYIGHPIKRESYYFCSEFVADTLIRGDALRIGCDPALVRPSDFLEMVELEPVYAGTIEELEDFIGCGTRDSVTLSGKPSESAAEYRAPIYAELFYSLMEHFKRA